MFDNATFVSFNLPVGTVMTLMDNVTPVPGGHTVSDLSNCGRCVDLVGTGQTEGVNLMAVNMNDCVSSFFWREVDLDLGAIEIFDDVDFGANRNTLFLSEWNSGRIYSIEEWWLQDRVSSIRWRTLNDRQTAQMFDNVDGSGDSYNNIKGYGTTKEIANLDDIRLNDRISSFRWDGIVPKKEIIAPFDVKVSTGTDALGLTSVLHGTNGGSLPAPVVLTLNDTTTQTVTVSTTDTHVTAIKTSYSQKNEPKVGIGLGTATTWSIEMSYSYTHSDTKTTSETKTITLSIAETVMAQKMTTWKATLLVTIGKIPATVYNTTAQRWYDEPVTGGVPDPANNGWYKRIEPVSVTVEGSLATDTSVNIEETPIT